MLYFNSPKTENTVRQSLRIIKRYQYTEFFVRKGAVTEIKYNVFYFKNDVIKIIHDK
jgi:hypothetical protein